MGESEYLAAAAMESIATKNLNNCLTNRLIELLKRNIQAPMSVASIAATLISEMGMPAHELANTPVYVSAHSKSSSVLASLTADHINIREDLGKAVQSSWSVLVTFRMAGAATTANIERFKKYLLSHDPAYTADIKIDAAYGGHSHIVLIRMPIEVWSCLRESEDIVFVSFVQGGDILKAGPLDGGESADSLGITH